MNQHHIKSECIKKEFFFCRDRALLQKQDVAREPDSNRKQLEKENLRTRIHARINTFGKNVIRRGCLVNIMATAEDEGNLTESAQFSVAVGDCHKLYLLKAIRGFANARTKVTAMAEADASDMNYDDESNRSDSSTSGHEIAAEQAASDSGTIPMNNSSRLLSVIFPAVYALILFVLCLAYGVIPGPELIALSFFIYAAYNKRSRRFVKDWFPFVSLILGYEALYALVPTISRAVHINAPINADMRLIGFIPTLVLQQYYRTPFLDWFAAFFYSLHFILPILFAFLLWKYEPKYFGRYTLALIIGTYAALMTFLIYPVAPPWYGLEREGATRILLQLDKNLGAPFYHSIVDFVQSNQFAAFPSLHAMYPWLISLYALRIKGAKALPVLIIPFGVWFSTIYLGEHYVIDVIGAVIYGTCTFLLVERIIPFLTQRFSTFRSRFFE